MKCGFVFTNFRSSEASRQAVESISRIKGFDKDPVVIVDNASGEAEIEILRRIEADFPNVRVIYRNENAGYFRGLNEGIRLIREQHRDIDVIVAGNNDLVFPGEFFNMIGLNQPLFEKYPVISPDIMTTDGEHQNPHVISRISMSREIIYDVYYSNYMLARIIRFLSKATKSFTDRNDEKHQVAGTIWQGYGACYLLGPVFFRNFGELWSPAFLMGEEFFLSRQLEEKGFSIWYEPSISVKHIRSASIGRMPTRKMWEYARESHAIYRKYVSIKQ